MGYCRTVRFTESKDESVRLEQLLWEVLWAPLNLPRDIGESFKHRGERIEVVAEHDGAIVGGFVANWDTPKMMLINHMAVVEECRERGVGRALVERAVVLADHRDAAEMSVVSRNTSAGFYEKCGFVVVPGEKITHQAFEKHGISFQVMVRKLSV